MARAAVCLVLVAALAAVAAGRVASSVPAALPVPRIAIQPERFDPAVITVPPGTTIEWRNGDVVPRALAGDVASPAIPPGGGFRERFDRVGSYDYRDAANPAIAGTVVVAARFRRPPAAPAAGTRRAVTHRWRATFRLDVAERWRYLDGKFRSFQGVCNAEVGDGDRFVTFRGAVPALTYTRAGPIEVMTGTGPVARIPRFAERVDAMASDPSSGRTIACPDGSIDVTADVPHACRNDFGGRRTRTTLSWSPRIAQGRLTWKLGYPGGPPHREACGDGFLAVGSLAGVDPDRLSVDPGAGSSLPHDLGRTSPLTAAETAALRAGRALTITRAIELHFTTDCCAAWTEPGKPTTYVRVGARYDVAARVVIRLVPR